MRAALPSLLVVLVALTGCGGDGYGDDDSPLVDAGDLDSSSQDAVSDAPGCNVTIRVTPNMPMSGGDVMVQGEIDGAGGFVVWEYQLRYGADEVPFTTTNDGRDMLFRADRAGIYDLVLTAGGTGCAPFFGGINVTAAGANSGLVRIRMVPPPGSGAPPQERLVSYAGGADYAAGILALDPGVNLPITVRTPAPDAQPVAAYLRFSAGSSSPVAVEGFSDSNGNASARLVPRDYDVLIVPTNPGLAPRLVEDWDPLGGALTVDAGQALSGTVRDDVGGPIAGARVSLMSGGVPSTIGTTAADGSFSLRWRDRAGAEILTVTAPDGSQRPRLDANVELGAISAITIEYAAVPTADVGGTLVRVGGAPVASTDVMVILNRAACGTVRDGANLIATASGSHRRTLRTDPTGLLPAASFVEGTGAAFITIAGGPGATATFPVPAGSTLDGGAPVEISGQIMRSEDAGPRPGGRVRATLTGSLAHTGAPSPTAIAGTDGRFSITVAAGASYTLSLSDPTGDDAAHEVIIAAAATADLGPLALPAALAIRGTIQTSGSSVGVPGVGVAALCQVECSGLERSRPLGEAVSDEFGRFFVTVPDPGVASQ